jgi:hypothetical protein
MIAEVVHTKPPGGPFWQLVELFLILPLRAAARWLSLIDALVVAVRRICGTSLHRNGHASSRLYRLCNKGADNESSQKSAGNRNFIPDHDVLQKRRLKS